MENVAMAKKIRKFVETRKIQGDVRIYFDGTAWDMTDGELRQVLDNINPKEYFEYANKDMIALAFEGEFNHALNYGWTAREKKLQRDFDKLVDSFGCYYEYGDAWNLSLYRIREER